MNIGNDVMVPSLMVESQPQSNPTIVGQARKYHGIGRVLIAYGIKLSIDHACGGTVTFGCEESSWHIPREIAKVLQSFGGAPRYELSGEAAMKVFVMYLKGGVCKMTALRIFWRDPNGGVLPNLLQNMPAIQCYVVFCIP